MKNQGMNSFFHSPWLFCRNLWGFSVCLYINSLLLQDLLYQLERLIFFYVLLERDDMILPVCSLYMFTQTFLGIWFQSLFSTAFLRFSFAFIFLNISLIHFLNIINSKVITWPMKRYTNNVIITFIDHE